MRGFVVGVLAGSMMLLACGESAHGPTLSSRIPADVSPTESPTRADFDDYSWRIFVAMNWPTENGVAASQPIGTLPDRIRVWETYIDPTTIMTELKPGVSLRVPETPRGRALNTDFFLQAGSDLPLVDRTRNFTVNELVINHTMADFTVDNGLTSKAGWSSYAQTHAVLTLPTGSIEIKAGWRVFPPGTGSSERDRYYVRNATISVAAAMSATDQAFEMHDVQVGLIALHIIQKTPTYPQWIWSTFEHVDLYDGENPVLAVGTMGDLASNRPPPLASTGERPSTYLWSDPSTGEPTASAYLPPAVARSPNEVPLDDAMNRRWQEALPSPWSNYRLILTQWSEPSGRPHPTNTTGVSISKNAALETFLLGDQTISLQVPGIDTDNTCPEPGDDSTLWAEIEQIELYNGYPETGRTTDTWSSCFMCHQLALYKWGDTNDATIQTDYSFVYKTVLPSTPCTD